MKKLLIVFAFNIICYGLAAQDFEFGKVTAAEMDMPRYSKDTTAHAVVLKEFGKTWLTIADDHAPLVCEYHTKIKIFDNQAFDLGTVEIPVYKHNGDRYDVVNEIEAVTYYNDENGVAQKIALNQKNILHVKENAFVDVVKFTLPGLRKGCIIEYKYRLEKSIGWTFQPWFFQTEIPKMYSEYEAHLPALYNYNVTLRGPLKLTNNKADIERDCFTAFGGVKCDCSKITYIMADIPAFKEEEYMTAPKNFKSAIYFELSDYVDTQTGAKKQVAKEWKDVDLDVKRDDAFGGQIKKGSLMKDRLPAIIAGKSDDLSKAQAIYNYMQKNFKWNGYYGWLTDDGIKKALISHTGDVADINLSLITALTAAGINTEAVLLSTRDHGVVNKLYPVETDFNYVVAKVNIGDKSYLLDATDPLLPFGLLPLRCINDQGRVMSMNKPSYWIDLVASQKRMTTHTFDLTLQADGKIKGSMVNYSMGYAGVDRRRTIKKFNSVEEFIDDYDKELKKIKIVKSDIKNLDSLDKPLVESYEIEISAFSDMSNPRLALNLLVIDKMSENPFKLQDRTYPIDMGAISDERVILSLHLPNDYTVETLPDNTAIGMPLEGGRFYTNYSKTDDGLIFSNNIQFTRSVYSTSEYPYLKEMLNKIIQAEAADVVIKKKL